MTNFDEAVLTMAVLQADFEAQAEDKACLFASKGMAEAIGAFRGILSRNLGIRAIDPTPEDIQEFKCRFMSSTAKVKESNESSESPTAPGVSSGTDEPTPKSVHTVSVSSATGQTASGKTTGTGAQPSKKPAGRAKR